MTTQREETLHRKVVQLNAENLHLKDLINKQNEQFAKDLDSFRNKIESIIQGAKNIMTEEGRKCRDCDINALHKKLEALRPLRISTGTKKR